MLKASAKRRCEASTTHSALALSASVELGLKRIIAWARDAGLTVVAEAFADRAYTPQGTLVSRREKGSVLHDPQAVAARMLRLAREGVVEAIDGSLVPVQADSICVHGDSPGAVAMARRVREVLEQAGVAVQPFLQTFVQPAAQPVVQPVAQHVVQHVVQHVGQPVVQPVVQGVAG